MRNKIWTAMIVIFALSACIRIDEPINEPIFQTVEDPIVEFADEGGSKELSLATELDWEFASIEEDWISVSPMRGLASERLQPVTFTAIANSGAARSAKLTLKSGLRIFEITVNQAEFVDDGSQAGDDDESGDDEGGDGGQAETNWLELPETSNSELIFIAHDAALNGRTVRNWSCFYDKKALLSHWVAYPMYKEICQKTVKRTDRWAPDPKIPASDQPSLNKGYNGGYSRGHQIASSDRQANTSLNNSTFYFTNMTPQIQDFNGAIWNHLEQAVQGWCRQMDTLYVVTGCDINGSTKSTTDNSGKKCVVPVGYYKALLGYKANGFGSGKYIGIAYYFDHKKYPNTDYSQEEMTIDELEKKMGIDFFVNLPAKIGTDAAAAVESKIDSWW